MTADRHDGGKRRAPKHSAETAGDTAWHDHFFKPPPEAPAKTERSK